MVGKMDKRIKIIPCVEASDMPENVIEWCIDHNYDTHYQNNVAQVYNDDNPFANWLREIGYTFVCPPSDDENSWDNVAIIAT